jgi:hypothetical protein
MLIFGAVPLLAAGQRLLNTSGMNCVHSFRMPQRELLE